MALTVKEGNFVALFCAGTNATDAYAQTFNTTGWKRQSISKRAWMLRNKPEVSQAIQQLLDEQRASMRFGLAELQQHWVDVILADPNELTKHRRVNCRHCWGTKHKYQWRDQNEYAAKVAEALDHNAKIEEKGNRSRAKPVAIPDSDGGFGFNRTRSPHPDCSVCAGEGEGDVYIGDTSKLSERGKALYAGVKVTRDGIQILMQDKQKAQDMLARTLGAFKDNVQLTGPGGGPIAATNIPMPQDPIEAARLYQQIVSGKA